jgi:hypothetical protein
MLLGSGLTPAEQRAFAVLLKFFEHDSEPERKALALVRPFTIYAARVLSAGVELSDENIAHIVMQLIADSMPDPEVEILFGERRDTLR